MKITTKLNQLISDYKSSDDYWVEAAKLQFAVNLEKQRKFSKITYKTIADKICSSSAYISKIFRGDTNLTIESMVKLARATGGHLDIQIRNKSIEVSDWSEQWNGNSFDISKQAHVGTSAVIIEFPQAAANKENFWKQAA